jgi:hypothetical protein
MFGVGAAAVVAAGIWLLIDHSVAMNHDSYQTSVEPMVGPREFGLVLTHRGSAL